MVRTRPGHVVPLNVMLAEVHLDCEGSGLRPSWARGPCCSLTGQVGLERTTVAGSMYLAFVACAIIAVSCITDCYAVNSNAPMLALLKGSVSKPVGEFPQKWAFWLWPRNPRCAISADVLSMSLDMKYRVFFLHSAVYLHD